MNEFESDWISLIQNQSGVRLCFWMNLREDNKVSESKMAVSEFNMAEFKMAAIISLSQNEWVKFFCANGGEATVSKFFLCKWWEPFLASVSGYER